MNKSLARNLNDHIVIIAVLAVVAAIYIGLTFQSGDASHSDNHIHTGEAAAPVDMAGFIDNLPTDLESLISMGNALMDRGQYQLAVECYSRAVEQDPENTDIRTDLGTCRHALGRNQEAINDFMKVLEIDPTHRIAKYNLGIVYLTLGDTSQTIDWWQKLLNENPPAELKSRLESILQDIRQGNR